MTAANAWHDQRDKALVLAALAAPLMSALLTCGLFVSADWAYHLGWSEKVGWSAFSLLLVPGIYPIALLAEAIVGVPLIAIALRMGLIRWWSAAAGGILAGLAADLAIHLGHLPTGGEAAFLGFIGAISGLSWWLVWTRGRLVGRAGVYVKAALFMLLALAASWAMYVASAFIWMAKAFPTSAPRSPDLGYVLASLQGYAVVFGPLVAVTTLVVWAGRERNA